MTDSPHTQAQRRLNEIVRRNFREHIQGLIGRALSDDEWEARWNKALVEYDRAYRDNLARRHGKPLTDEEWEAHKSGEESFFDSHQPGNDKSALFTRLLTGKPALRYPPPCSHSYPWYAAIESQEPIDGVQVAFEGETGVAMTLLEHGRWRPKIDSIGCVQICGSLWALLKRDGKEAIVTYGEWAAAGFRWRLTVVEEPTRAEGHGTWWCNGNVVLTGADVRRETLATVNKAAAAMRRALAGDPVDVEPALGEERFRDYFQKQEREQALARIADRTTQGKPPIPTEAEIAEQAEAAFTNYLGGPEGSTDSRLRIGPDDRLLHRFWRLERISPVALSPEHYLESPATPAEVTTAQ